MKWAGEMGIKICPPKLDGFNVFLVQTYDQFGGPLGTPFWPIFKCSANCGVNIISSHPKMLNLPRRYISQSLLHAGGMIILYVIKIDGCIVSVTVVAVASSCEHALKMTPEGTRYPMAISPHIDPPHFPNRVAMLCAPRPAASSNTRLRLAIKCLPQITRSLPRYVRF